ncbi:hypothetical protein B9Q09_01000 [Candidatus Marsarchaeota G2 archaeon ECH_B_SAG-C16]|uniref:Sortilin N-terminal domain-containing protein n=1 Tax=Candidatus Marsarchaeota G2 archaeon ECH_B_SAG-C16 TaxID=1978163 RepID=A0A2R6BFC2_9ARCH|nr:MAG: hypothetical protein B9Q09_01000 [Candidatus Marsarchaeota G2 archaeon ECH_B_SAG-C16]
MGESVNSLSFDVHSGALYAATHTEGVFVSRDGGGAWKQSSRGLHVRKAWTIGVDPHKEGRLYVGTQSIRWPITLLQPHLGVL